MINPALKEEYPRLLTIWENAVKATHDFLSTEDFEYYKSQLPVYFKHVDLYTFKDEKEDIKGFLGIANSKIEMLFIDSFSRGKGIGKSLLSYAVDELKAIKLDVNEQNKQAVGFYLHSGFKITGRSELDNDGKNYPLLHMEKD